MTVDQQEKFAQEYVVDLNATRAATRAGYSPKGAHVQGFRLLNDVKVSERIAELKAKLSVRMEITQERVIEEYAKIAFSNVEDVVAWINADPKLRASGEISHAAHAAISEITVTPNAFGNVTKVKLHDKKGALDSLAKHLGILTDKVEHSGTVKTETSFWVNFVPLRKNGTPDTRDPSVSLPPKTD